jgi:hypothetical protein
LEPALVLGKVKYAIFYFDLIIERCFFKELVFRKKAKGVLVEGNDLDFASQWFLYARRIFSK